MSADRELLARIQAEEGVQTEASPSLEEYATVVLEQGLAWLEELLGSLDGPSGIDGPTLVTWLLSAGIVVVVLLGLAELARRRLRRRPLRRRRPTAAPPGPTPSPELDPLAEALARGDSRAALSALWVDLARDLDAAGIGHWSPDRTEREFIASVRATAPDWGGLAELRTLGRTVVAGVYGPQAPPPDQVEALVPRARALGATPSETP